MIRLSNFDIKYQNAEGVPVTATAITAEQRQLLANYNAINLTHFIINLNYFYYEEIIYTCCSLGNVLGS